MTCKEELIKSTLGNAYPTYLYGGKIDLRVCLNDLMMRLEFPSNRCVSENECFSKWWIITADDPRCLSMKNTPTGQPGQPIECNYCCKGAGCNQILRIPDSLLYTGEDHPSSGIGGVIQIG